MPSASLPDTAGEFASSSPPPADSTTKDRLLDVAEELFADEGFEKVSLRHLTQAAGVNLAAVNYHFGSKDGLIEAVVERFVTPVNRQRLANLDTLEAESAPGTPIPIRALLNAFIQPFLARIRTGEHSQRLFFKLMARCMADPGYGRLPESTLPLFRTVAGRYSRQLQRTTPHLSEELVFWRLHFTFGVLVQTLAHTDTVEQITEGRIGKPSPDQLLDRIIDFCVAGFTAPSGKGAPA